MTVSERKRCALQIRAMSTTRLKKLASLMERCNLTERETLVLLLRELESRGVNMESVQLMEASSAEPEYSA